MVVAPDGLCFKERLGRLGGGGGGARGGEQKRKEGR